VRVLCVVALCAKAGPVDAAHLASSKARSTKPLPVPLLPPPSFFRAPPTCWPTTLTSWRLLPVSWLWRPTTPALPAPCWPRSLTR
jgi:hypothetical protein